MGGWAAGRASQHKIVIPDCNCCGNKLATHTRPAGVAFLSSPAARDHPAPVAHLLHHNKCEDEQQVEPLHHVLQSTLGGAQQTALHMAAGTRTGRIG